EPGRDCPPRVLSSSYDPSTRAERAGRGGGAGVSGKPLDRAVKPEASRPSSRDDLGAPSDARLQPHAAAARARLATILGNPGPLPLLEATLLVAAEEHPGMDVLTQVGRVMTIAGEARERVAEQANPFARLEAVRSLLFDEIGLKGNVDQYDDPRNSYLDDVLDRKLGIPLS